MIIIVFKNLHFSIRKYEQILIKTNGDRKLDSLMKALCPKLSYV